MPDETQPPLVVGQIWYPRPGALTREILDRDQKMAGEFLVKYREGTSNYCNTEGKFREWIAAFAATLEPRTDD